MTSVPNLQPLLSGSKYISFWLIVLVLFSCDPAKRAHKNTYPNGPRPEHGTIPKPKKKDPVVIKKPKKEPIPEVPNTLPNDEGRYAGGQVNVAVLLPFLTNKFNESDAEINAKSQIAIQFYGGFKLALEEATINDVAINVNVLDTKASASETISLLDNPSVQTADIIIGPFRKKNAATVAEHAVKKGQVLFSPFREIDDQSLKGKGFVVQTFVGLDTYMEGITKYLIESDNTSNVVVIKRKSGADSRAVASLRKAYGASLGSGFMKPLKEIEVDDTDLSFDALKLKEMLMLNPKTVFVIPVWKGANYVSSIVRKIFVSRNQDSDIMPTLVGMPQWLSFKNADYEKLNALNTLIPTADILNVDKATQTFAKRFHTSFGSIPDKNAYKGFDVGRYLLQFVEANTQGVFTVPNVKDLFLGYEFEDFSNLSSQPIVFKNKLVKIWKLEDFRLK